MMAWIVFSLSLAGCAGPASTNENGGSHVYEFPVSGVTFQVPESYENTKGMLKPYGDMEYPENSGIYCTSYVYRAMTKETFAQYKEKGVRRTEEETAFLETHYAPVFCIAAIPGHQTPEDVDVEFMFPMDNAEKIGTKGDYDFFLKLNPYEKEMEEGTVIIDGEYRQEFDELVKAAADKSRFTLSEPGQPSGSLGKTITFQAKTVEGSDITSEELFSANAVTAVNIWATDCPPCLSEMPDFEDVYQKYREEGFGIVGIVRDVKDEADTIHIEDAKDIISRTGVSYPSILPWSGYDDDLSIMATPTTYFVDSKGVIISGPIIGQCTKEKLEETVVQLLQERSR